MSDINNIDQLLKDNFVDFTPDAPDVWQGIQQGVQAVQAAQAAGSATAVVKGTGIVVKIIATVAVSASIAAGYMLLTEKDRSQKQESSATVVAGSTASGNPEPTEEQSITPSPVIAVSGAEKAVSASTQPNTGMKPTAGSQYNGSEKPVDNHPVPEPILKTQPITEIKSEEKVTTPTNMSMSSTREMGKKEADYEEEPEETIEEKAEPAAEHHSTENSELFIPTVITPNGDGKNDRFVIPIENEQFYFLTIMDKNGNKVFESNDKNVNWDGRDYKSGLMCPQGTYFMIFRYQIKGMQTEQTKIGKVTLL